MAPRDEPEDDIIIDRPNREKSGSKVTKYIVILLLLVSTALLVIVSVGGWDKLAGARPLQIAYIILFLMMAFFVARWSRGVLPVVAALAIILLIFATVSATGWYERDKPGFADTALPADLLGLLCLILVPVQILLIAFSLRGFQQAWNVEVERPRDEEHRERDGDGTDRDDRGRGSGAVAAPA